MRSSITCGLMVTFLVVSSGCKTSMPRWNWWSSTSTSADSAANIAQSGAPALPSSVASSGVSAPTGQYPTTNPTTAYPTTPASAYGAPNMANTTPVNASATAGAVGPQTSPYNPYAYGPPAGAAGQAATQGAYAPPASPSYTNTATAGTASNTGGRYGATAAGPPAGYQSGSRYDAPATGSPAQASAAPYANTGMPAGSQYTVTHPPENTSTAPVDYRSQAPVSTADARSQYQPVQGTPAGSTAPTSTAGTPYRPAGTSTYTPVGASAPAAGPEATQPASYQQTAPSGTVAPAAAGQYNPAPASPSGSDSRYGGRY